ncbi:MAG: hypothetical protein HOE90_24945 [Bacteriovoracaceae bacterium]|jgi:hypothetical protein|nr:hypothetical protein [Bacteriovoracaceae bacterium]
MKKIITLLILIFCQNLSAGLAIEYLHRDSSEALRVELKLKSRPLDYPQIRIEFDRNDDQFSGLVVHEWSGDMTYAGEQWGMFQYRFNLGGQARKIHLNRHGKLIIKVRDQNHPIGMVSISDVKADSGLKVFSVTKLKLIEN